MEQARTVLESGITGARAITRADMEALFQEEMRTQERITNLALAVTLVITRGAAWRSPWPVRSSSAGTPSPSCAWPGPACPSCAGW